MESLIEVQRAQLRARRDFTVKMLSVLFRIFFLRTLLFLFQASFKWFGGVSLDWRDDAVAVLLSKSSHKLPITFHAQGVKFTGRRKIYTPES